MNEELTAEQACRQHLLTQDDFLKECNTDGSLKSRAKTTTISLRNDDSKSVTVNTAALQATLIGIALLVALTIAIIVKRHWRKKHHQSHVQ